MKAFAGTTTEDNDFSRLYHYNIAKNHNQRYTIIGKCDYGFYIIVLTNVYFDYSMFMLRVQSAFFE